MARQNQIQQCSLRKATSETSSHVLVSFLPKRFARRGQAVRLRGDDGVWDAGWTVEEVWAIVSESQLPDVHRSIRSFASLRRVV